MSTTSTKTLRARRRRQNKKNKPLNNIESCEGGSEATSTENAEKVIPSIDDRITFPDLHPLKPQTINVDPDNLLQELLDESCSDKLLEELLHENEPTNGDENDKRSSWIDNIDEFPSLVSVNSEQIYETNLESFPSLSDIPSTDMLIEEE